MAILDSLIPDEKVFEPKEFQWKDVTFLYVPLTAWKFEKFYANSVFANILAGKTDLQEEITEEAYEKLCDLIAKEAVVGWRNITDRNGKELPYSAKDMARILKANVPLFSELFAAITEYTEKVQGFTKESSKK